MVSLLDILTDADSFALLSDTNAADVMTNTNGQKVLRDANAADFLKDEISKNLLQSTDFANVVKQDAFVQKNNFETIKMLVEKGTPDDKLLYALQSVINGSFVTPKTGAELKTDQAKFWG